jgi:inhibitor of KinA
MYPCGDHALTIELGDTIDLVVNQKVISLFHQLKKNRIDGVKDIIPAYHSITLVYDTAYLKNKVKTATVYEWICKQIESALDNLEFVEAENIRQVSIPVCYDETLAPDLLELASLHQISIEKLIEIHTASAYRVFMIGFLPGFAYMGSVDARIATPRKSTPRTNVPAGSVGIAGEQTGIYPFDSPGGWQLIGRTPLKIFNIQKPEPCLLQPGDEVRFYPITLHEYEKQMNA